LASGEDAGAVDELLRHRAHWRSRCGFLELLEFIARFPAYSPLNAFLMHIQDPAATRVATAKMWSRKYQRRLLPGARPIIILAPMSPVLFVFDVRHTEGPALTVNANALPARGPVGRSSHLLDAARHNCAMQLMAVREATGLDPTIDRAIRLTPALRRKLAEHGLEPNARYLVLLDAGLSVDAKYAALSLELGRIFCGHLGIDRAAWWPDRKELDCERIELEAAAVAHLVCRRRGLAVAPESFLSACIENDQQLPIVSLNSVFQAVSHIEAMSRRPWKTPPKQGRH
jgi:hypothetical protein